MLTAVSLVMFFAAGQQSEMAPQEYLKRNLGLSWLLPLLYVLLALTLIVLIVLDGAFFFLRAISNTEFVGVGAAVTLVGVAMVIVAAGPLL